MLRGRESQEILDRRSIPPGHIARELLEHGGRSFAPPVRDRVRDLGARAPQRPLRAVQPAISDEIADVRHRPVGARLDEEIVVELIDVLLDCAELLGDDGEQLLEHLALRRVAHAVDRRQQRVEGFGIVTHDGQALAFMTVRASGRASSSSSSAPRSSVAPVRGGAAVSAVSSVAGLSTRWNTSRSTATTPATEWIVATTSLRATDCENSRAENENASRSAFSTSANIFASSAPARRKSFPRA